MKVVQTCKSCGAVIEWVPMPGGKMMPLDARNRTVVILDDNGEYRIVSGQESHFATCPDAAKWRTKGDNDEERNA